MMTKRDFLRRWQGPWWITPDPALMLPPIIEPLGFEIKPNTIIPVYGRIVSTSRYVALGES